MSGSGKTVSSKSYHSVRPKKKRFPTPEELDSLKDRQPQQPKPKELHERMLAYIRRRIKGHAVMPEDTFIYVLRQMMKERGLVLTYELEDLWRFAYQCA